MSATLSATVSTSMSATAMSSQRFVRSQRRWQNGNPNLQMDGLTGVLKCFRKCGFAKYTSGWYKMFPDPGGANFFKVDILRKICHFGVILVATLTPLMKNLLEEHPPSLTMTPYHSLQWGPTNSQRREKVDWILLRSCVLCHCDSGGIVKHLGRKACVPAAASLCPAHSLQSHSVELTVLRITCWAYSNLVQSGEMEGGKKVEGVDQIKDLATVGWH